jgi:two-component system, OmpR family, sensor histidine kinase KdpD
VTFRWPTIQTVTSRRIRSVAIALAAIVGLLAVVSVLVWLLQDRVGVPNASSVFLLAVVAAASRFGTVTAVATAIGAFFVYDLFFIEPVLTLRVEDSGEWLNLILLLVVGVVVGRLAAGQRDRAQAAARREREALALFRIGRSLATRSSTAAILPELASTLQAETVMDRVRITVGNPAGIERTAADQTVPKAVGDTAAGETRVDGLPATAWTPPASHHALRRTPGDAPAEWVRIHQPARESHGRGDAEAYRVSIDFGDRRLGSIWAVRPRHDGLPDPTQTRLLSAAADQIGQALELDRLGREAGEVEIARRSDALKTALLESVSHDLRTPLASIRAAAGTLLDRAAPLDHDIQTATAQAIDREAEHLNGLVTNLLDLSRIEAGELRVDPEPFELGPLVERVLDRLRARLAGRIIDADIPDDLPPVLVDEVLIDQVLTNLFENAIKYTGDPARIRIRATVGEPSARAASRVSLKVEDDGPGVPDEAIGRVFDRFFRFPHPTEPSRPGSGIGLTVVRGLVEAMGGSATASRSALGGLAIELVLPSAPPLTRPASG